jgi:hypothetical protein
MMNDGFGFNPPAVSGVDKQTEKTEGGATLLGVS